MTRQEVTTHPYYLQLSEGLQKFVTNLIDNGNNKRDAAHLAWACKNDASADTMARRAVNHPKVSYLMREYFGGDPLLRVPSADEVVALAWRTAMDTADVNGRAKLLEIVIKVKGYATKPADNPAAPAPASEVDPTTDEDLMAEIEKRSIDSSGTPAKVQV